MNCIFCSDPKIQERIICKSSLAFVFCTNIPIMPGHVLICPLRHVESYESLTLEERNAIEELRVKVIKALKISFGAEGFNFAWNQGVSAGQTVPHLHLHVLPRKQGDSGVYEYEPRKFLYRPGDRRLSSDEDLKLIAKIIKDAI